MSRYIRKPIGEVCTIRRGASPRPIDEWMSSSGMPWVKIADATKEDSRFIKETEGYIREEGKNKSVEVFPGDLIISNSATPALPKIMKINACIHDGRLLTRDFKGVTRDYLYYQVKYLQKFLVNQGSGSIFKNLKTDILKEFPIIIPVDDNGEMDISKQERITKVLENIEDKIELNNKINSELEAMAKEIYDYWFVQFDFPDENGKPYKSSEGKMVWNEELKREIPEGWSVEMIKDTFGSVGGYSFSSDDYAENGKYKLYTIGNVQDGYIVSEVDNYLDYLPDNMPEECLLKPGEMLMSLTGNVGRVGFVYENNALLNQRVLKLQSEKGHKAFMYMTFIQDSMRLTLERISNGTSQKNLSPINMGKLKMVVPPEDVLKKYDSMCNPMIDKMVNNFAENQKLSELRDFLLPMLMNGQVTVK